MAKGVLAAALALAVVWSAPVAQATTSAGPAPVPPSTESVYERVSRELLAIEQDEGADVALARLDALQAADPAVAGICHAVAHDLGHAALAAAGGSVTVALGARDDVCGGGFIHGVIETALGASTQPERDLLRVCAPAQDGSCWHGIGHGLMFSTGMDVERSLGLCDRAPSGRLSSRCGEGVFMQLFSAEGSGGHTAHMASMTPTPESARGICSATRLPYSANCWFYAPTLVLAERPDDFAAAMAWCREATTRDGRQVCARGVGSRTIKYHPDDPTVGARVCAAAGSLGDACLGGMGSYWSVHFKGERPPSDVCSRLGDAALERRCLAVT